MKVTITSNTGEVVFEETLVGMTFSTGSRGYHSSGKLSQGEKRYQVSLNVIEIGSKPR